MPWGDRRWLEQARTDRFEADAKSDIDTLSFLDTAQKQIESLSKFELPSISLPSLSGGSSTRLRTPSAPAVMSPNAGPTDLPEPMEMQTPRPEMPSLEPVRRLGAQAQQTIDALDTREPVDDPDADLPSPTASSRLRVPGETAPSGGAPVAMPAGQASSGYAPSSGRGAEGVERWSDIISEAAKAYNLPESTIKGLMEIESGGDPAAVSAAGAMSLMQVMPFHFGPGENGMDPRTNIFKGAKVYADALARYGDPDKAAAAYFGAIDGQGNITSATDATGTDGHKYVRLWRQAASKYGASPNAGAAPVPAAPAAPSPATGSVASSPPATAAGGSGGADTVTIEHIDDGRRITVARSALPGYMQSPAPGVPVMWRVVDGAPAARTSLSDAAGSGPQAQDAYRVPLSGNPQPMPEDASADERNVQEIIRQASEPNAADRKPSPVRNIVPWPANTLPGDETLTDDAGLAYRAPLLPTDPEASTSGAEYDPRDADSGPREIPQISANFPETPTNPPLTPTNLGFDPDAGPRESGYVMPPTTYGAGGDDPGVRPINPVYGPEPMPGPDLPPPAPVSPYDADQPFRPTPRLGTPANEIVSPPVATSPAQNAIDPNDTRAVDQGRWESPRYEPPTTWYGRAAETVMQAIAPAIAAVDAANEWLINNPVAGALNPQAWGRELGGTEQLYLETREDQQRLEALIRRYRAGDTSVEPEIQALTASLNRRTAMTRPDLLAAGERNPDKTAETLGQAVQAAGTLAIAPSLASGPVRNVVGAAMDPLGQGLGAGLEVAGDAIGAARGLGTRVRSAAQANAERVAAADARMAQEGSTSLPGTLGVAMGTDAQSMVRPRVVPPEVADTLDFPVRIPEDPAVIRAIEAAGGSVDPARGVDLNVIRYQGPEEHGRPATRSSTFYTADKPGAPSPYSAGPNAQVGGSDRIEAPTRFRSPLVLPDAPGSTRGFDEGVQQLGLRSSEHAAAQRALDEANTATRQFLRIREAAMERWAAENGVPSSGGAAWEAFEQTPQAQQLRAELQSYWAREDAARAALNAAEETIPSARGIDRAIDEARQAGPPGSPERAQALKDLVNRYGGDESVIDDLLAVRGADDSESAWAIKENILAHNARRQGYDGVLTVQQAGPAEALVTAHPKVVAAQKASDDATTAYEQALDAVQFREQQLMGPYGRKPGQSFTEYINDLDSFIDTPAYKDRAAAAERDPELRAMKERLPGLQKAMQDAEQAYIEANNAARAELGSHRITELADFREGANPTPGVPVSSPEEVDSLLAQYRAAIERAMGARTDAEAERLHTEAEAIAARLKATRSATTPPGYTLRSDIRRRGGETTAQATAGVSAPSGAGLGTRLAADVGSSLGSGTMGAAVGAGLPAETDEERRQNALRGAAVGMVAGPLASRAMRGSRGALATPGVSPGQPDPSRRLRLRGQQPITATPAEEVSRLRLDKFPEEIRADIEAAARDQDWARTQRRGVLPDAVVQQMAQDDVVSVDRIIKRGRAGKAYNPEETLAIRNAVASQANVVRELSAEIAEARANGMAPELLIARRAAEATKLNGLVQVAEGARAEAGRTLRAYRQQTNLIDLDPNAAVEQIYKRLGGRDNATAAVDEYTKMVEDGANPIQLAKFWAKVEAGEITGSDLFALYRRFNMLSGPRTVEVNALSGLLNLGYEVLAAGAGQTARLRTGEAVAEMVAPLKAGSRAFQNMVETIWHGVSTEQAARGDIPRTLSSRTDNRAAKAALTMMEIPDRLNAGVDQFFRTMTEDWAATRLAHQQVRTAGLTPRSSEWAEAVAKNLEAIRDDPSKFPEIKAMADRVTFAEEPGGLVKGLEHLKRVSPNIVGFILPFIRTPANIASRAVDLSPLGPARTAVESATGLGRGRANLSARVRDNVVGVAAAVWAYDQAQQGNVTGAGPDDPEKLAALRATGWQPYSIKIGDQYWSYANFAPFSLALSTGAAAYEAQKYKKPGKDDTLSLLADGAERTAKVVTDMTVLAGIGAVVKSIQDPDRYGTQWLTQALTQLIPAGSFLNTIGQATDTEGVRRAERDTVGNQIAGGLLARIPPNPITPDRTDVPLAQDPLGRPVPNEMTGFGALNPFRPTTERPDPTIQAFLDAGVDIGKPKETLTLRASVPPIALTPAEQRRWNEVRGEQVQQIMAGVTASPSYQAADKMGREAVLKRVLSRASDAADRKMVADLGEAEIRRRLNEAIQQKKAS